jgi:hypothetical protein
VGLECFPVNALSRCSVDESFERGDNMVVAAAGALPRSRDYQYFGSISILAERSE